MEIPGPFPFAKILLFPGFLRFCLTETKERESAIRRGVYGIGMVSDTLSDTFFP